ncbi:MAG: FHA domain-containing protein [Endomicrobiales bacterium]|jgi:pSer/pThr/pTyr-binding forkhead associated (FHA) protein
MAKLLLKFQAAVIKEISIDKTPLSIGRKPENDISLESLAVSSTHARLIHQGTSYVIEDLQSTNGTLLNGKRVISAALKNGDQIGIGQHTLDFIFPDSENQQIAPSTVNSQPATVISSQKKDGDHDENVSSQPHPDFVGLLRLVEGKSELAEYTLSALLTYIGKSETAAVKLRGLFAPEFAALISKRQTGYLLTVIKEGYTKRNDQFISGQLELKDGDLLDFSGLKFLFHLKDNNPPEK